MQLEKVGWKYVFYFSSRIKIAWNEIITNYVFFVNLILSYTSIYLSIVGDQNVIKILLIAMLSKTCDWKMNLLK